MKIFKRLMVTLGIILLVLLVLIATTVFVARNLRMKDIVEHELEQELGINVTIEQIYFSPLLAHIEARGITVHNAPGFKEKELAYIDFLRLNFDPLEMLIERKPHVNLFVVEIKRLNVVRNAQGKINIKEIVPDKEDQVISETQTPFYFDVAIISIKDVNFIDYKSGHKKEYHYPIHIMHATFMNLKNGSEVVNRVVFEALKHTEIGKLVHVTFVPIASQVSDTMSAAWGMTKSGVKSAWEIFTIPANVFKGK